LERTRLEQELNTRRQRSGMVDAGFLVQELDARVGGGILAGALAFRIFLFMVPLVYVVFTVLGTASTAVSKDPAQLARDVGITGVLASAVVQAQDHSAWTLAVLVAGAALALFLTAGSLVKALYVVHWLIWRIPRATPAGMVPRLALIGVALTASALGVAVNRVRSSSGVAGAVIAIVVITAVSFALWWWVSWKLPHAPAPALRAGSRGIADGDRGRRAPSADDLLDRPSGGQKDPHLWFGGDRTGRSAVGLYPGPDHRGISGAQRRPVVPPSESVASPSRNPRPGPDVTGAGSM
jgi:hypothetical protein